MEDTNVEVMPTETVQALEKALIDIQISTAHAFPRSMEQFKKRATEWVTLDEETAKSCIYRRPVGKEGNVMKYAEGKSIRMAEIVGACYGNLRVGATVIEQTSRYVKCRGVAHDLESNFASSCEIIESTVTSSGQPYSERMRIVVVKAALAKARRDATFQVVPGALCKSIEIAARDTALGKGKTMEQRRAGVDSWIKTLKIPVKRVWASLGVNGLSDLTIDHLTDLIGIKTALDNREITIDEAFPDESKVTETSAQDKESERLLLMLNDCKTIDDVDLLQGSCPDMDTKLFDEKREQLKATKK
jgi:hypothetical protein